MSSRRIPLDMLTLPKNYRLCVVVFSLAHAILHGVAGAQSEQRVSFSREILPILSDKCFSCHGPDESQRAAELRLDSESSARAAGVIDQNDPGSSELIKRIASADSDVLMPPPDSHRSPLTKLQVAKFEQWIRQGGEWEGHWAFEKPVRPQVEKSEATNPIDYFIEKRLANSKLVKAERAPWHTLLRRTAFDLTGMPPSKEQSTEFLKAPSVDAFNQHVEQLFASQHYGERMAMWWLDAARYSDTDGYQQDATRSNWPWRDWVIDAFNNNMPFDEFTIQQFAGDLLENPTPEQILATCFHRNHMFNGEGGRHPEESRVDYVIDRVNTTGTVWLGLTVGCAQCHTHKFDPLSHHDYYRLSAFFNSIDEDGKAGSGAKPFLKYRSPHVDRAIQEAQTVVAQRQPAHEAAMLQAEQELDSWLSEQVRVANVQDFNVWKTWTATALNSAEGTHLTQNADGTIQASGLNPFQDDYLVAMKGHTQETMRISGIRLEVFPHSSHTEGKLSRGKSGEFILTDVKLQLRQAGSSQIQDIAISSAVADAEKDVSGRKYGKVKDTLDDDPRNGWTTETHNPTESHTAIFALDEPVVLSHENTLTLVLLHRSTYGDANIGRFRLSYTDQPESVLKSMQPLPLTELSDDNIESVEDIPASLRKRLWQQFLSTHVEYQLAKSELAAAKQQLTETEKAAKELNVTILREREQPRQTFVLERGVWDQHGDQVNAGVPPSIMPMSAGSEPSRLDLAHWLIAKENPLTARVIVNQLWQMCFGHGLVRTPEDFGLQGEPPTHPELLDWLAVELTESSWDVQHILRLILTSDAYQRSSVVDADQRTLDPENRQLARMTRSRLPAWMIRDSALQTSGLLNGAIGGPPMRPYQPDGIWAEIFMGRFRYQPSQGETQFRRTIYAFWRRSAAPTFLFDSSQRRVCEVRPRRTNTPLHALTLLNDLSMLESARQLARQAIHEHPDTPDNSSPQTRLRRIAYILDNITGRAATEQELALLDQTLENSLAYYEKHSDQAAEYVKHGQPETRGKEENPAILAAYAVTASLILNLDEAITRE